MQRKYESQFAANPSQVAVPLQGLHPLQTDGHAKLQPMPLNLHDANQLITRAQAKATELGIRVTVAIVDEGGLLIALSRMDGAGALTPQIAEAKAVGAAMLNRDGAGLAELAKDRPGFFNVADRLVRVPIVPGLGSVLIKREGKLLGAVGVSGGRPEQDLECAEAGLSSV
jgi:uncharacterized protein GlcG (DUF336 family)